MSGQRKFRSRERAQSVIAISISYQRSNLLARGMGIDHLRELLLRIARPILRQDASIAYGGNWLERDDNFTFELLRLVSAEQEDKSSAGEEGLAVGKLYNHLAWPYYLEVTPKIEAQWINSCRIVRVTQAEAGLEPADIVADADAKSAAAEPRTIFNSAVTLSKMRASMMDGSYVTIPGTSRTETIPPVVARVLLGGSVSEYAGFVPGIFEELLVTLDAKKPAFVLGGFGGAAEVLADAILDPNTNRAELTIDWHVEHNARLQALLESCNQYRLPPQMRGTQQLLAALAAFIVRARQAPAETLQTGLNDNDTRELLRTRDIATAVRLVKSGLKLTELAA